MAFFQQAAPKNLGLIFRQGLDDLRSGMLKLAHCQGSATGMTDQQFAEEFGFADVPNARNELLAGTGNLLNGDANLNGAQIKAAVDQMLNQFG